MQPLLLAKRASEAVKMPIMVHVGNTPMPLADILAEMRRGDILTHCFHGSEQGILDDQGNILDAVREAVKKGVNLDVGHGRGSFSFNVAEKALAQQRVDHIGVNLDAGHKVLLLGEELLPCVERGRIRVVGFHIGLADPSKTPLVNLKEHDERHQAKAHYCQENSKSQ